MYWDSMRLSKNLAQSEELGVIIRGSRNVFMVLPTQAFPCNSKEFPHQSVLNNARNNCVECRLKGKRGKLEQNEEAAINYLTAGDLVAFEHTDNRKGIITQRIERKNSLSRMRKNSHHTIAVNLDLAVSVFSVSLPDFSPVFFDKILCMCLLEQVKMIAVLNKTDLLSSSEQKKQQHRTGTAKANSTLNKTPPFHSLLPQSIQNRVNIFSKHMPDSIEFIFTSVKTNQGIQELATKIEKKFACFIGRSGVGKTSLLNKLAPEFKRKTAELSRKYDVGRHTTTMPELCFTPTAAIVDTPGMKDIFPSCLPPSSVGIAFPEFSPVIQHCKLPTCSHRNEPGCALLVEIGKSIEEERYQSYLKLRSEIEYIEKKQCYPPKS